MSILLRVDVYTHNFVLTQFDRESKRAIIDFAKDFVEVEFVRFKGGRTSVNKKRVFAASTESRSEYRFHIHVFDNFISHMKRSGVDIKNMRIITHDVPVPDDVVMDVMPTFVPFDYQVPLIEQGASLNERIQALVMAGGLGKTSVALVIASRLGVRTAIVLRGMYVERWEMALIEENRVLDLKVTDFIIVRGAAMLIRVIRLAKEGKLTEKILIITNMTLYAFFQAYELFPNDESLYGCKPIDLYRVLGIGFRIIDEVHQDFHSNFRQDLYANVMKTLSLSGSLKKNSSFINRMYEVALPLRTRIGNIKKKPYCAVTALFYQIKSDYRDKLRYLNNRNQYSHNEFESNILRDKKLKQNYLDIIVSCWDTFFTNRYEDGMKGIVFAGRVEMCDAIVEQFRLEYPNKRVERYTSDDEYENLLDADIVVSTLLSAGTAVDVKRLRTAFMTTAVGSIDANIQAFWRIRELKEYPHVTPDFIYLVCSDIPQHREYHRIKVEEYKGYALSHSIADVGIKL